MILKLAVIGNPISHSLSPAIHGAVFKRLGIECEYTAHQVEKGDLGAWIECVKRADIQGFNVTMPHKQDIIEYLDELDEPARVFNSVNTVKVSDGQMKGYSTDGGGFCMALKERGVDMSGKRIVIAGAGGAANVVAYEAERAGADSVVKLNRSGVADINRYASRADVFVNATPLGMHGCAEWESLDFVNCLPQGCAVYDLIYNPLNTKLLAAAARRGLLTINGLSMLVYQAVLSDEIYLRDL